MNFFLCFFLITETSLLFLEMACEKPILTKFFFFLVTFKIAAPQSLLVPLNWISSLEITNMVWICFHTHRLSRLTRP